MKQKLTHAQISKKGGSAGRGAAKRRTREQCQAAAQARWAKRQPKSEMPNAGDKIIDADSHDSARLNRRVEKLRAVLERIGGHEATEALSRDMAIARRHAI